MMEARKNCRWVIVLTLLATVLCVSGCFSQMTMAKYAAHERDCRRTVLVQKHLSDEAALVYVAIESDFPDSAQAAVEKIEDTATLARIAVEGRHPHNCEAAIGKLTDQKLLTKLALEDSGVLIESTMRYSPELGIRQTKKYWVKTLPAVAKVTDHALLAKLAMEGFRWEVRFSAVERIDDQAVLAKVALEDDEWSVRRAAVARLTDQRVIEQVALGDSVADVREAAVGKLTDQAVVSKIAGLKEETWEVRRAAIVKLPSAAAKIDAYNAVASERPGTPDESAAKDAVRKIRIVQELAPKWGRLKNGMSVQEVEEILGLSSVPEWVEWRAKIAVRTKRVVVAHALFIPGLFEFEFVNDRLNRAKLDQ